jgi:hypothetical protein
MTGRGSPHQSQISVGPPNLRRAPQQEDLS